MGEVYSAYDQEAGLNVALKTVSQALSGRPEFLEQTRREMRIARKIQHPNVCHVYDVHRYGEQVFLSMELLEGETLQQRLAHGPLPEPAHK